MNEEIGFKIKKSLQNEKHVRVKYSAPSIVKYIKLIKNKSYIRFLQFYY